MLLAVSLTRRPRMTHSTITHGANPGNDVYTRMVPLRCEQLCSAQRVYSRLRLRMLAVVSEGFRMCLRIHHVPPSATHLPPICHPSATHLPPRPTICHPFATHLPPTCHHLPPICHPPATICHPSATHLPPICHPSATHLPPICHPFATRLPQIPQPFLSFRSKTRDHRA